MTSPTSPDPPPPKATSSDEGELVRLRISSDALEEHTLTEHTGTDVVSLESAVFRRAKQERTKATSADEPKKDKKKKKKRKRTVHPMVRSYYVPRTIGHLVGNALIATLLWEQRPSAIMWSVTIFMMLVEAHLVYFIGRNSKKPMRVELSAMLFENLYVGVYIALTGFRALPATALSCVVLFNAMVTNGIRFGAICFGMMAVGCGAAGFANDWWMAPSTPGMTQALSALLLVLYMTIAGATTNHFIIQMNKAKRRFREQKKQFEQLVERLSKYLSPQVFDAIFKGTNTVQVESARKTLSVVYCDIVGFTELAEEMPPRMLTELLNDYLDEIAHIALMRGGTIDKFLGASILIFYGSPETRGEVEDARAAAAMCVAMRDRLAELRGEWLVRGLPEMHVRFGVHTGSCLVGNFGSDERLEYTIVGHTVNVAELILQAAEPGQILASAATWARLGSHAEGKDAGEVALEGVREPMQLYSVLDVEDPHEPEFERAEATEG